MDSAIKAIVIGGLKASIILLMFSLGLGLTRQSLTRLWQDSRLLIGSVAAAFLVVPLVTYLIFQILPLSFGTKAGLWAISITPGAPMIYRKAMQRGIGEPDLAVSFQATVALLVIVLAPVWMEIVSAITGGDYGIPPGVVLKQVSTIQFVPIIAGMALRNRLPGVAERIAPVSSKIGSIALLVFGVILLAVLGLKIIAVISGWTIIATMLISAAAIIGGHLLTGPEPSIRLTIANANAQRNPGLALVIAAWNVSEHMVPSAMAVVVYLFVSVIATAAYTRIYGRRSRRAT